MNFYKYDEAFSYIQRVGGADLIPDREAFYKYFANKCILSEDTLGYRQSTLELMWIQNKRPYYNVWPDIIPMLIRLDLDKVESIHISPPAPVNPILVRFPVSNNPFRFEQNDKCWTVRSVMMGFMPVNEYPGGPTTHGICLGIDVGERIRLDINSCSPDDARNLEKDLAMGTINPHSLNQIMETGNAQNDDGFPIYEYRVFPRIAGQSIQKIIEETCADKRLTWSEYGVQAPKALVDDVTKLCCTLCLLADDPDVIEADVLNRDEGRFQDADAKRRAELIDRAKRRGKFGWTVGKKMQSIPHYRRPHPALVWTGKGRKIPKIIMRKGAIVHRQKLTDVPTGYAGKGEAPQYDAEN